MKIKSARGLLALWSAFLAAGTWMLPMSTLFVPSSGGAHALAAVNDSGESSKLISLSDVLVDDLVGDQISDAASRGVLDRLGVPVAVDQPFGLISTGRLGKGLDFNVMFGSAESGFSVGLQVDSMTQLHRVDASATSISGAARPVTATALLFSGSFVRAGKRVGALGLASVISLPATQTEPERSVTQVLPLGEVWHLGLASAFVNQTAGMIQGSGDASGNDAPGGGGIACMPECYCACSRATEWCNRAAILAFLACVANAMTWTSVAAVGTCLACCAFATVGFLPCVWGCVELFGSALFVAVKACLMTLTGALLTCQVAGIVCNAGCDVLASDP